MPARIGCLAMLLFAALPLAASAEGVRFTVPDHYLVVAPNPAIPTRGVYRVWDRRLDGVRHSIVVSATPTDSTDLGAMMDAAVARLNARQAISVSRNDAPQLCGLPSVRIAYAFPNQLTYVFRYAIVGGRLLIASYAHPLGTAADPPALASLDTLCSGIHQPGTPTGWTIQAPYPPNGNAWQPSPDNGSLLAQVASAAKSGSDLSTVPYKGKGTVVRDRQDACGAITIRRVTATLDDGHTLEFSAGTVYGYDYVVAYTRPPSEPVDPGALDTLTSFCADSLPPN